MKFIWILLSLLGVLAVGLVKAENLEDANALENADSTVTKAKYVVVADDSVSTYIRRKKSVQLPLEGNFGLNGVNRYICSSTFFSFTQNHLRCTFLCNRYKYKTGFCTFRGVCTCQNPINNEISGKEFVISDDTDSTEVQSVELAEQTFCSSLFTPFRQHHILCDLPCKRNKYRIGFCNAKGVCMCRDPIRSEINTSNLIVTEGRSSAERKLKELSKIALKELYGLPDICKVQKFNLFTLSDLLCDDQCVKNRYKFGYCTFKGVCMCQK